MPHPQRPELARSGARLALIAALGLLGACSHLGAMRPSHWHWPWRHAPAAPGAPVNELVVTGAAGSEAPVLPQAWDRNALRIDLGGLAGEGELRLRPVQGHDWPIRLEFAVRPGAFGQLDIHGEQRVILKVPADGATALLAVPQGLYAPATPELLIHYGP